MRFFYLLILSVFLAAVIRGVYIGVMNRFTAWRDPDAWQRTFWSWWLTPLFLFFFAGGYVGSGND